MPSLPLFFAPPDCLHADTLVLPRDEAHHATRVLRLGPGSELAAVDGAGSWYRVRLDVAYRDEVSGTVLETKRAFGEPAHALVVGLAVLKNPARYETFLEKAVELGVTEIVPLLTERTEREGGLKPGRVQNILISALKQCGRSRLPALASATPLADLLTRPLAGAGFICHEAADPSARLLSLLDGLPAGPVTLLIGPEGGFSDAEVAQAAASGYRVASLGPRRLRAETAALTAAAGVMLARGT